MKTIQEQPQETIEAFAWQAFKIKPEDVGYGYVADSYLAGAAFQRGLTAGEIVGLKRMLLESSKREVGLREALQEISDEGHTRECSEYMGFKCDCNLPVARAALAQYGEKK